MIIKNLKKRQIKLVRFEKAGRAFFDERLEFVRIT